MERIRPTIHLFRNTGTDFSSVLISRRSLTESDNRADAVVALIAILLNPSSRSRCALVDLPENMGTAFANALMGPFLQLD